MSNAEVFEGYIRRFAAKHGISPEEALKHKIVTEYKNWIDKECQDDHTREEGISEAVSSNCS